MKKLSNIANKILTSFSNIFHDSPAWAEFTSASSAFFYIALIFGGYLFADKHPASWPSLDVTEEAFQSITLWIVITMAIGNFQFVALIVKARLPRACAAFAMMVWLIVVVFLAWPTVGWSPMLAFPLSLCIPNFFAIARHARDWGT